MFPLFKTLSPLDYSKPNNEDFGFNSSGSNSNNGRSSNTTSLPISQSESSSVTISHPSFKKLFFMRAAKDAAGIIIALILIYIFYLRLETPTLLFRVDDPSISYPAVGATVSSLNAGLLTAIIPIIVIILFNIFIAYNPRDIYAGIVGLVIAYVLALSLTSILWVLIGGLRPHFLDLCNVDRSKLIPEQIYYTLDICKNKSIFTNDTFHGFPSGHVSTSFATLGFLSCYLFSHLRVWKGGNAFKLIFALFPLIGASIIGFSRINDYHHNGTQVFAGFVLGLFCAFIAYRMMYVQGFFLGYGRWAHIPFVSYL